MESKWNKAFRAREYYEETIGNITGEAVQKYKRSRRRSREKRIPEVPYYKRTSNKDCDTVLRDEQ